MTSCFACLDSATFPLLNQHQIKFTCLVESKPVKQEVFHTVILPLMKLVGSIRQCDQIWRFIVSKSFIFLVKPFLGNFYRILAIFIWSHWYQVDWRGYNAFKGKFHQSQAGFDACLYPVDDSKRYLYYKRLNSQLPTENTKT